MPTPGVLYNILQMDLENELPVQMVASKARGDDEYSLGTRQRCGCLRTSEKLRQLLGTFPAPPPPTPAPLKDGIESMWAQCTVGLIIFAFIMKDNTECVSANCKIAYHPIPVYPMEENTAVVQVPHKVNKESSKAWRVLSELAQLLQLTVTATALAMYYLVYCYMQLIYYTLRSALYFHQADGPMKITIGVVSVTSVIIAFNVILRLEKVVGIFH